MGTEDFTVISMSILIPLTPSLTNHATGFSFSPPIIRAKFCSNQPKEIKPQERLISAPPQRRGNTEFRL